MGITKNLGLVKGKVFPTTAFLLGFVEERFDHRFCWGVDTLA